MKPIIAARDLAVLQADAEALMVDEFEFGNYGAGWHYDPTVDADVRDFEPLFTTPGRVLTSTAASESEAGDRTVVAINRTLHVPASKPTVPTGTVARRASDGAEFRVLADLTHPQPKSRRFAVEEVLS